MLLHKLPKAFHSTVVALMPCLMQVGAAIDASLHSTDNLATN
jgi:hypothetical protein